VQEFRRILAHEDSHVVFGFCQQPIGVDELEAAGRRRRVMAMIEQLFV
jgi:hypothetical protein